MGKLRKSNSTTSKGASAQQYAIEQATRILKDDFPEMNTIPDMRYYLVAIWYCESAFRTNPGRPDSCFLSNYNWRAKPSKGFRALFFSDYVTRVREHLTKVYGNAEVARRRCIDIGFTKAHGVGQVMGDHYLPVPESTFMSGDKRISAAVKKYGLIYDAMALCTTKTIQEAIHDVGYGEFSAMQRSMGASATVLYSKFLKTGDVKKAIVAYMGGAKATDIFGNTGESYLAKVTSKAGVVRSGGKVSSASTQVASKGNTASTASATTGGGASQQEGCTVV